MMDQAPVQNNRAMSKKVKDYNLYEQIGKGAFGEVYLAQKDGEPDQLYAVKVVNNKKIKELSSGIINLDREIGILQDINHEHIIKLHLVIYTENNNYLVMEYCESNFSKVLQNVKDKGFNETEALYYLKQIINAMKYLHTKNIMHQDIKPANILIKDGKLKLADFGIAKIAHRSFTKLGTLPYMAPEILFQRPPNEPPILFDDKVDLYSVGVVYYEMLFGRRLFPSSDNPDVVREKVLELLGSDGKKLAELLDNSNISYYSKDLLKKAIVLDPKKRISWEECFNHPVFSVGKNFSSNGKVDQEFESSKMQIIQTSRPENYDYVRLPGISLEGDYPISKLKTDKHMLQGNESALRAYLPQLIQANVPTDQIPIYIQLKSKHENKLTIFWTCCTKAALMFLRDLLYLEQFLPVKPKVASISCYVANLAMRSMLVARIKQFEVLKLAKLDSNPSSIADAIKGAQDLSLCSENTQLTIKQFYGEQTLRNPYYTDALDIAKSVESQIKQLEHAETVSDAQLKSLLTPIMTGNQGSGSISFESNLKELLKMFAKYKAELDVGIPQSKSLFLQLEELIAMLRCCWEDLTFQLDDSKARLDNRVIKFIQSADFFDPQQVFNWDNIHTIVVSKRQKHITSILQIFKIDMFPNNEPKS
jgi:serine/threonine protein kinase